MYILVGIHYTYEAGGMFADVCMYMYSVCMYHATVYEIHTSHASLMCTVLGESGGGWIVGNAGRVRGSE